MRNGWPLLLAAATLPALVAPGPVSSDPGALSSGRPVCTAADLTVDGDFEQAGYAACAIAQDGQITLTIRPEVEPINPSAWYAARLVQTDSKSRTVRLRYAATRHRYEPWISVDGTSWQRLPAAKPDPDGATVTVDVPEFRGTVLIAAQPLQTLSAVLAPWQQHLQTGRVVLIQQGSSRDGRSIPLYRHGPARAARVHVFTARQHPPETTGAVAFDAFAETVLAGNPAARCPGQAFWFAPVLNPDGIVRGHWRSNSALVDLNRDWGRFEQPETAAIGPLIGHQGQRGALVSVLDFHSTRRDALYTPQVMTAWAQGFSDAVAAQTVLVPRPTRSGDATTLKSWGEKLGAATFTVELADGHSPESAAALGRQLGEIFLARLGCPEQGAMP